MPNSLEKLKLESVRQSTQKIFHEMENGGTCFEMDWQKWPFFVEALQREFSQKDLKKIGFHSRLRHYENLGPKLSERMHKTLGSNLSLWIDLITLSVLLDAGAGAQWKFCDPEDQRVFTRSEGLAVAVLCGFLNGQFGDSLNTQTLKNFDEKKISELFQVSQNNPLDGLSGRLHLIHQIGSWSEQNGLPSQWIEKKEIHENQSLHAEAVFDVLMKNLIHLWPERSHKASKLGDCWEYQFRDGTNDWIAFHKLTQWLTYSWLDVFKSFSKSQIIGLEKMTGLAEYRNGGLFIDSGVLQLKNPLDLAQAHAPSSQLMIEWRALTIVLLDQLHKDLCQKLKLSGKDFPLVCMLEAGTWALGRKYAYAKRPSGAPPLQLLSDGTVF